MLRRMILCTTGVFAVLLSACSDEASTQKTPRAIKAVTVKSELVGEVFRQTGEIRPRYETPMSFRIDGLVAFRVETGSSVKKGDVLATVEKTPALINVASASAQVDEAKSDLALADLTAARNWELIGKNAVSRAQVQQSDANLQAAKSKLEVAAATLASAQQNLSYTDLKAGRDGVVSGVSINVGQVVTTGQTVLTLSSDTELDAVFDVPEQMLIENLNESDVEVSLLSNPTLTAKGKVREVTPSADAATRTYRVKVTLDGALSGAPLGAAVAGKVTLSPKRLFKVPASALTSRGQDQAVFVYLPETRTLQVRSVKIERYGENDMLISEGLADGDIVATAGVSKLRDGEAVTVEKGAQS
ncbi:efflux RND transporter periplasmic adaptor subunit [Agrobacterium vitis]|uniref:Efflux RND transporter periplasmic adaptor subunit n=1 Tax=Agrobacterium vitis TaxID=373 RepID=A0AAE4WAH4_AGRVI|nr:efflux RND transporter periplasmic adaptor subunit [Agrobacterium vitis]MCF1497477.1 efflux RND transporter periplasmic adaptor subunit [Allorhizobium sp. Av2]MCM2438827.1 efflux RND transporter periplasmic adaptor subunit [Agrobacterium vitis]MUZ56894.1 efflux RND transporter periplasmic adaptor subunit [Agrobacterium vitis]MVA64953.1 efflux RND transporter periplasmic adaptor subunit [Agrobacterium vitis]MVA85969.1 efflux RND transporter periplasmic adaptor subunit [Agrobacterium vitis]